jgi:iron complex outermembrane receptor protein
VYFDNGRGRTLLATAGIIAEDRSGGTLPGRTAPDGAPFREALASQRVDAGFTARWLTPRGIIAAARGSAMRHRQNRQFGGAREHGAHGTWFGEASVQGAHGIQTWVAGAAFQQDLYRPRELTAFAYTFSTPSLFTQDEIAFTPRLLVALSARADFHSQYGTLATPRVSVLARPRDGWTIRASAGTGAFAPTPFTEETEETGLTRVQPLQDIRAERARGGSFDVTRAAGPLEITGTLFASRVDHPVQVTMADADQVRLANADGPTRSWGTELLARYRAGALTALVTHAWTRSTERDPDGARRRDVPLTPSHAASLNVMWEVEGRGRLGIETYYVGALVERTVGRARLFLNSENLLDVRQTKEHPLVLPARAPDGRWTVDAWAPLDGRVINGGVRVSF